MNGDDHTEADGSGISELFDELEELADLVDSPEERKQVREAMRAATEAQDDDPVVFGRVVWGFDREDLAEAALGSLLFGIPMAVESGTIDAGRYIAQHPLYLLGTLATAVVMVVGILYVADFQDVRVASRLFGLVPRRLAGVTLTAYVVSVALLTGWGVVAWPVTDPAVFWQSFCVCSVAFVPMAIGAALGDILPGS
ncbi:TIGR02587 family membrane protein [Haloarcula marina]|uniref:TIGR02587 family membrane protein n=1 Tax=Haloarcula marina TaxID=2961574 RepID=UPI0020B76F5E|nr:TIGR02587 family membrane protein [Halomicroarcula marina]